MADVPMGHALGGFVLRGRPQSDEHVKKRVAAIKASLAATTRTCVECGEDYHPTSPPQKYCSGKCFNAVQRRKKIRKSEPRVYLEALEYAKLLVKQDGKCGICDTVPTGRQRLCVDHDHATGRIRGLLCHRCNTAIGLLRDDPVVLDAAIRYLTTKE